MPSIIFSSLKESFSAFFKYKKIILALFVLQIILLIGLSYVNMVYGTKIIENEKAIFDYMSKLELDEKKIADNILQQKNLLGDDPLSISRNFNEMKNNLRIYMAWFFALLLIFMSSCWHLSHKLINSKQKAFSRVFLTVFSYLVIMFFLFLWMFSISLSEITSGTQFLSKYILIAGVMAVLAYFMFISLALAGKTELKNILEKTLIVGIRKAHYIIAAYSINILLFVLFGFSFIYSIDKNIVVMFLSIFLIILNFVFSRIFIINVIKKLD
ncbi:MAG TPA: hypothetical protein VJI97_01180 [Candidatus Nanoarchaeia archaeon]|nr:hypothetical protein [Candidatus Nanoarchaeia archaeon]